jgi:peptide/nickel transport system substrate-binding protein
MAALGGAQGMSEGGTFLVAIDGTQFTTVDPALFQTPAPTVVLAATCGQLLRTTDAPLSAGHWRRIVPELAAGLPKITDGGRTYTFTIRKDMRFSTGAAVTARDVAYTLNRIFNPALKSGHVRFPGLLDIVGAQSVLDGTARSVSGILARGDTLTIRLTKPVGGFTALMASPIGCVLPATLPFSPDGVSAPVPSAGPYYVSEFVPGQRVVLQRNPFYSGGRPHHVDRFVIDLTQDPATVVDKVERGELDYAWFPNAVSGRAEKLARTYGIDKSRFFVAPTATLRWFVLNTAGALFKNNPMLRQAVNFALDRKALAQNWPGPLAGIATDQYLPPGIPGFRNARIYPFTPDFKRARALARGHTRGGRAVLYIPGFAPARAQAQIVEDDLKKIGLDVVVEEFPPLVELAKVATPGEPFDIAWYGFSSPSPADPSFLAQVAQVSRFTSRSYDLRLQRASLLPFGPARDAAYGKLDVALARNAAPAAAYAYDNALTLVSARTGCVVANPYLDLAAVCIK